VDDREFLAAFEDCSLPASLFAHRDHVRLAWLYLRRDPLPRALEQFSTGLKRYATSLGAAGKYHETITWALLFLIHERMLDRETETFEAFLADHPSLVSWKDLLSGYYREETLASERARTAFVMPDRLP
jgi:hypothetical protein